MKKFFTLLCAVVIALSASAAPKNAELVKSTANQAKLELAQSGLKKITPRANVAVRKAPQALKDVTFDISVDSIEAFSAKINVTPSDDDAPYYWDVLTKAQADTMADASIAAYAKSILDYYASYYNSYYGGNYFSFVDFLLAGADSYTYSNLEPATTYVVYAAQLDENTGALIGSVARFEFTTASFVPSGDTISVVISDLKFTDKVADAGWWQMYGYSADSTYYVTLSNGDLVSEIVGTYTYDQMDADYSYMYINDTKITFVSGTIVVSQNADGTYRVDASLVAQDGNIYNLTIESKKIVPSTNVITITYNANDRSVSFATTNNDEYFFYIESKEEYESYQEDYSQTSLVTEINEWIDAIVQQAGASVLNNYILSGNQSVNCIDFFGQYAETDDYVVLAAPVEDGEVNGTATYLIFHFDYPEAIENTEVEINAVKKFENGVLLIEKNGKKYNALGIEIK